MSRHRSGSGRSPTSRRHGADALRSPGRAGSSGTSRSVGPTGSTGSTAGQAWALQRTAGNQAVAQLLRWPVVQRNGLAAFSAELARTSDLTMLAVMLPRWDSGQRTAVADHLGISRFKELVFALGETTLDTIGAARLLAVGAFADVGTLPGISVTQVIDVARRWKATLPDLLRAASRHPTAATSDQLRPAVKAAPPTERDTASKDAGLMAVLKAKIGRDAYLDLLPALGVYDTPSTGALDEAKTATIKRHMQGPEADVHIRRELAAHVAGAVRAGRTVEGEVSVVGDSDFQAAFDRQWVDTGLYPKGTDAKATCNAFVDVNLPKRHIWVHRDLGNPGTVIHEGMHKYADPTLRNEMIARFPGVSGISQLDEGITEYFTRIVTDTLGISRGNYQSPWEVTSALAGTVGRSVIARAYYDGDMGGLKAAYAAAKGSASPWDDFGKAIEERKWSLALARA